MYCRQCGYELNDQDKFCPNCGATRITRESFDWNVHSFPDEIPHEAEDVTFDWGIKEGEFRRRPDVADGEVAFAAAGPVKELFGGAAAPGMADEVEGLSRETAKIDKFYIANRRKEEYQKLLDSELEKFKSGRPLGEDTFQEKVQAIKVATAEGQQAKQTPFAVTWQEPAAAPAQAPVGSSPEPAMKAAPAAEIAFAKEQELATGDASQKPSDGDEPEIEKTEPQQKRKSIFSAWFGSKDEKGDTAEYKKSDIENAIDKLYENEQYETGQSQEEQFEKEEFVGFKTATEVPQEEEPKEEEPFYGFVSPEEREAEANQTEQTEQIERSDQSEAAEDEDDKVEGRSTGAKIAIVILSIILVVLLVMLAMKFIPSSDAKTKGPVPVTTDRTQYDPDLNGTIQLVLDQNDQNRIDEIAYDSTITAHGIKKAKGITNNVWYKDAADKVHYIDTAVLGTTIAHISKSKDLDKLAIGPIMTDGKDKYYIWVIETKKGKMKDRVYTIKAADHKMSVTKEKTL